MTAQQIKVELLEFSSDKGRERSESFFKMGKGDYSEHDEFIGVRMPDIRRIARDYKDLTQAENRKLLSAEIHEERLCALIILVLQMKSAVKADDKNEIQRIAKYYLNNKKYVNNWDLVDASAHYILGHYIVSEPEKSELLYRLAQSHHMWDRRIAMVSQWLMIREGVYDHVLPLVEMLLGDNEDLMHKAVGWMLREYWKKDPEAVEDFTINHYKEMHRTTLRYLIVHFAPEKRKQFLHGIFA